MTRHMIDSLIANEFRVQLSGHRVDGVTAVRHLMPYTVDDEGRRVKPPFELTKIVERDINSPFNQWLKETLDQRHNPERPRRDISVLAMDEGIETRRWHFTGAYIQSVRYSDFDSSSFELVGETLTIGYDDVEESWSATIDAE